MQHSPTTISRRARRIDLLIRVALSARRRGRPTFHLPLTAAPADAERFVNVSEFLAKPRFYG